MYKYGRILSGQSTQYITTVLPQVVRYSEKYALRFMIGLFDRHLCANKKSYLVSKSYI